MSDTLYGMAESLLGLVVSTFNAEGVTPPSRQVVYMSPIPADCEQVAVLFSGWDPYPSPEGPQSCVRFRWLANFSVIVTRCTPAIVKNAGGMRPTAPSVDMMKAAAKIASDDAECLLTAVLGLDEVGGVGIITGPPSGGLQTVELNLQIPAGGI